MRGFAMVALKLISHKLCPYVQRAVIALTEKGVPFERIDIDLSNKPERFLRMSPLGKTPVLLVGDTAIFESAVILEYLEDIQLPALHPADALARAEHRAWIEFGSAILNDIAGLYAAADEPAFSTWGRHCGTSPWASKRGSRRPCSAAGASAWSMLSSARCSAISMRSTASAIWASSQTCRRSPPGA